MIPISKKGELIEYYQDSDIANKYIKERFETPLGLYFHFTQVNIINNAILNYKCNKILDMACGPARLSKRIKNFKEAIGLDSSEAMLKIARKDAPDWNFVLGDACNTNFKDESFDLVFTFRFIRHLKKRGREEAYREIKRLLKGDGIFIFDAVNYEKDHKIRKRKGFDRYNVYDKLFKREELISEIKEQGLKIVQLIPHINHLYISTIISKITGKIRLINLGFFLIRTIERIKSNKPLEWIIICKKK